MDSSEVEHQNMLSENETEDLDSSHNMKTTTQFNTSFNKRMSEYGFTQKKSKRYKSYNYKKYENEWKKRMEQKVGLNEEEHLELDRLESFLLGNGKSVLENVAEIYPGEEKSTTQPIDSRKPAWKDDGDSDLNVDEALASQGRPKMGLPGKSSDQYQEVLKKRFEARIGNPGWAKLGKRVEGEESEDLLKHCGNFIDRKAVSLPRGVLDIKRLHNLNKATGREGPHINAVQFHPTSTVALVAGRAGVASIFQVDGVSNPHLQTVKFDKFPIRCARFSQDGGQFIVGSQHHNHYYVYDMMEGRSIRVALHHATEQTNMKRFEVSPDGSLIAVCGRFGHIHLLHARTREWIGSLQMNGEVTAICFNHSGSQLWSHGVEGEVYIWDMASRKCLHRFADEGCLQGSSLAVSASGQLVACGSRSGVVNVYETVEALASRAPRPTKPLMHLVTAATMLRFNTTSQILAMASDEKDNALKLVHFPTATVFGNFPLQENPVGRVISLDFSPASGYMALGNSQHAVHLFRLKHFGNY